MIYFTLSLRVGEIYVSFFFYIFKTQKKDLPPGGFFVETGRKIILGNKKRFSRESPRNSFIYLIVRMEEFLLVLGSNLL
jgi:hypothetical protein